MAAPTPADPVATKKAIVRIVLDVDELDIANFMEEWTDLVQRLIEKAGIVSAEIELPSATISLSTW